MPIRPLEPVRTHYHPQYIAIAAMVMLLSLGVLVVATSLLDRRLDRLEDHIEAVEP